ncbi:MAG: zinc ribbon domain-containing protein [Lachnospiraceae bacterium]|nr:zinc ribbon domain-containing protein [Lachnospiraceae bacterium]
MAFCSNCGKEIPDGANACPACGAPVTGGVPAVTVDEWDHTEEFDAQDISDNKVYALSAYLFSFLGILLCNVLAKKSDYALFHARESLKINVAIIVVYLLSCLLCWTCIVPVAGVIVLCILGVVKIICFVQVCKGKAVEPWLIRSIKAFK